MKLVLPNRVLSISRVLRLAPVLTTCLVQPLLAADTSEASHPVAVHSYNLGPDNVALSGYDPVRYFTDKTATKGSKEISAVHQGVTYYFVTDADRKLFTASPQKYLPAYGGWCATAMAKGDKVQIDLNNFKITNGRLLLFYKGLLGDALNKWNKDEAALAAKADAHWKKIANE